LPPPAAPVLHPVRGLGAACRVAWIWTRAFTGRAADAQNTHRQVWRLMGLVARPGYWLLQLLVIGAWGPSVVWLGRAAAQVPNPRRAGRGSRPAPLVLLPALLLLVGVALAALWAGWPLLVPVLGSLVAAGLIAGRSTRTDPQLGIQRTALEAAPGQAVTVVSSFAAWPKRSGHGGPLLKAILAELQADGVRPILHAVDENAAGFYRHHGAQTRNPQAPMILSW